MNINNYSSNFSTNGQFKKVAETPVIKAVRKTTVPQNTPSINLSNKKKVSAKKDITTAIVAQTPTPLSNKTNSVPRENKP